MDFTSSPSPLIDNGFSWVSLDSSGTSEEEIKRLKEELKIWKERVEEAEKIKADLLLSKKSAEEECDRAEKELTKLKEQEEQHQDYQRIITHESELSRLKEENAELKAELEKLREELEKYSSQDRLIKKEVAEMKLKFTRLEDVWDGGSDMDTECVFWATAKIPFRLNQNQALLTFEDEEVAQRLTEMNKHTVNLESRTANVTVQPPEPDMGFKFKLHVTISGKKINVSEIPELPIPEECMRDKLELNFYKAEQGGGGGEIEDVTYDRESGTAVITFLHPGASNRFVGHPERLFSTKEGLFKLSVSPYFGYHLINFQPFCGVSKKTILLQGIPEMEEDEESVQDMIEIHFQKPSNGGGEIENIKYTSKEAACVCLEEDTENAS